MVANIAYWIIPTTDITNNGYYYIGSLIYASNNGNLQIESTNFASGRINLVENTLTNTLSQDIQYHHTDHLTA